MKITRIEPRSKQTRHMYKSLIVLNAFINNVCIVIHVERWLKNLSHKVLHHSQSFITKCSNTMRYEKRYVQSCNVMLHYKTIF